MVETSESTRWYSWHCPEKDLLHKSQALLPNRRQSTVLSCKIKACRSAAQHREQSVLSKETQTSSSTRFPSKNQKYICSLTGKALQKNFLGFYYKCIYKKYDFLLAVFLNDDFNFLSDFSYAKKKKKSVSIGMIRLCESLHQTFLCAGTHQRASRGLIMEL